MEWIPVPLRSLLLPVALTVSLIACRPIGPTVEGTVALCEAQAETLANLTYSSEVVEGGRATLQAGEYRAPAAPDSAAEVIVEMSERVGCGELNDIASAGVVLVSSSGGSGTFYSLHAVQPLNGSPEEVAYTMLGDRIVVEQVTISDNLIRVDMIAHGPDDPLCCPTQPVTQAYALEGRELRLVSTTPRSAP